MRKTTIGHLSVLPPEIKDPEEGKISVEKDYMLNTLGVHRDFKHRQLARLQKISSPDCHGKQTLVSDNINEVL